MSISPCADHHKERFGLNARAFLSVVCGGRHLSLNCKFNSWCTYLHRQTLTTTSANDLATHHSVSIVNFSFTIKNIFCPKLVWFCWELRDCDELKVIFLDRLSSTHLTLSFSTVQICPFISLFFYWIVAPLTTSPTPGIRQRERESFFFFEFRQWRKVTTERVVGPSIITSSSFLPCFFIHLYSFPTPTNHTTIFINLQVDERRSCRCWFEFQPTTPSLMCSWLIIYYFFSLSLETGFSSLEITTRLKWCTCTTILQNGSPIEWANRSFSCSNKARRYRFRTSQQQHRYHQWARWWW